jgi:hypothetical protein
MYETRRTRKTYFSEKIAENTYIKHRPVMGKFTRERAGRKHFFTNCGFVPFFTADNREKFLIDSAAIR